MDTSTTVRPPAGTTGDRIAGGLWGLLIGDALGVPYEFKSPEAIPPFSLIEMVPPVGFHRSHAHVPPGTWSDDGAQALVLLDSLVTHGELDLDHFGAGLLRWREEGFYAVDGHVFDIGIQTAAALGRMAEEIAPARSGLSGERHNGNGSLMRVLPIALWTRGDDEGVARAAIQQSLPTHAHPRSAAACAFYCLFAQRLMRGLDVNAAWDEAADVLRSLAQQLDLPDAEVMEILDPRHAANAKGTGYVVDSLWSARQCLENTESFEDVVRRAVALGHDTDTTAAIAGGLAGVRFGLSSIPDRWFDALRGKEMVVPLLEAALRRSEELSSGEQS